MKGVRVFEMSNCVICWGDGVVPTTILKPCGHRGVCDACLNKLLDYDGLCPLCRQAIVPQQIRKTVFTILAYFLFLFLFVIVLNF